MRGGCCFISSLGAVVLISSHDVHAGSPSLKEPKAPFHPNRLNQSWMISPEGSILNDQPWMINAKGGILVAGEGSCKQ